MPLRRLCRVEFFFERIQECNELDVWIGDRVLHCFGPRGVSYAVAGVLQ